MNISYADIVAAELIANDITLCAGCNEYGSSHARGFAVPDKRVIHYSAKFATRSTLFGLLHEVGHVVRGHGKACKLRRYEKEQQAEDYARESFEQYGIAAPRDRVAAGVAYIARFKRFGDNVRRGRRA